MDPTESTVEVTLFGKQQRLTFDFNTYSSFEEKTGKPFLEFLSSLVQAVEKAQQTGDHFQTFRAFSMRDFQALVWAALHTYDENDVPQWPYTYEKVGRLLDLKAMVELGPQIVQGGMGSLPADDEVDSVNKGQASGSENPTKPAQTSLTPAVGGDTSGPLEEEVLALVQESSDD